MAIIPNFFLDAVVAIGKDNHNDDGTITKTWIGTGFLVGRKETEDTQSIYLITNRHVVKDQQIIYIRFNKKDGTPAKDYPISVNTNSGDPTFSVHPNYQVDIVAMNINPNILINDGSIFAYFGLDNHALTLSKMKETGVDEGSLVYALGFPMNLVGEKKKAPICRLGCISRISDVFDESNNLNFLIDAQTFPGNSGGPVVSRPENMSINGTISNSSANLIGILHSYIPYIEMTYSMQTGRVRNVFEENSGLTWVHPVDLIKETVDIERERISLLRENQNRGEKK